MVGGQGRIQDLKLGVAQMYWKIGGMGMNIFKWIYISQIRLFYYNILYLKSPYLSNIVIKKSLFGKILGGGGGAPL